MSSADLALALSALFLGVLAVVSVVSLFVVLKPSGMTGHVSVRARLVWTLVPLAMVTALALALALEGRLPA